MIDSPFLPMQHISLFEQKLFTVLARVNLSTVYVFWSLFEFYSFILLRYFLFF